MDASAIKLALAVIGLILFGWGIRVDVELYRWIGMGFVVAAWLMRFASRKPPRAN